VLGDSLTLEIDGATAILTIEGAPRNELTFERFDALVELMGDRLPFLDVEALIITGRGRHFSSGSRVDELRSSVRAAGNECSPSWCEIHTQSFQKLRQLPYPTVAAIAGCCLGSGLELALSCTARVAATNALLALPEAQHELIPGCGGTVLLTELVGYRRAMQLILSGEGLSAAQALELGLVDSVVERANLLAEAKRIASCIRQGTTMVEK
jgi:enoyl-CoA hydratase/carnithine racemase